MITLKTLPQATAQEVFDTVKNHLFKQGAKSAKRIDFFGDTCAYRGRDGLKCAAGCLIGDDEYVASMEKNTWRDLADKGIVPNYHLGLIHKLQKIHDNEDPVDWAISLESLAKEFGLKY